MEAAMSTQEQQLCEFLMRLAERHACRYSKQAERELLNSLFWCMVGGNHQYMDYFFPTTGGPLRGGTLKLGEAQGAVNGAEYTEAARGHACGHIFRTGEATYSCKTCGTDDTCCLCSRCFEATDHRDHMVRISVSPGNSGCCDCGDAEAWKTAMFCTIHSAAAGPAGEGRTAKDKGKGRAGTPSDLEDSIRRTISRVLDFMCDVISCSPEQLRQTKTVQSIESDERMSRLSATYGGGDGGAPEEYAVLLWNDEKHTVNDVMSQVARACRTTQEEGLRRAYETDEIGRSLLKHSSSVEELLGVARTLEDIKVTVTIRSSRDTFREQMCGTIIEWLSDIAGCSVGEDHEILRRVVCEQLLQPWRKGSPASHAIVGENGIDDEELMSQKSDEYINPVFAHELDLEQMRRAARAAAAAVNSDEDEEEEEDEGDADDDMDEDVDLDVDALLENGGDDEDETAFDETVRIVTARAADEDVMMVDASPGGGERGEGATRTAEDTPTVQTPMPWPLEMEEGEGAAAPRAAASTTRPAVVAAAAAPSRRSVRERDITPSDSDTAEPLIAPSTYVKVGLDIPKTPGTQAGGATAPANPGKYWLGSPVVYEAAAGPGVPVAEDLMQRVRLDWLVLFDLRMWKKVRNDLRSLYISTVVTIPSFKRVLGLRFAWLYTKLAQLYLIGDREPDHSIINISLQMLTTPSITAEIVERGNFLTSLMAILYTFLTTRQVGHAWEVSSSAVLAFDSGSVTNRRMYHFFVDLKFLFLSSHVQERLRTEERYMMQFLDLVKLHQGICPNTRAVGEHVEYETDTWIGASLITREINRLCRQFAESFRGQRTAEAFGQLARAIRYTAKTVILHAIGAERQRFSQAEIRDEVQFHTLTDFEFDGDPRASYRVVRFVVEKQPISFHHALHYTLSWLVECGKAMSAEQLRALLGFSAAELRAAPRSMGRKVMPRRDYSAEDYLIAAFDYPLRVCAWLAQMKAGMWVRNGISLRHQSGTYRGVSQRDVAHHRDIFLLQTALVVCRPSRVLVSLVDRFGMAPWVKGFFEQKAEAQDDAQHLDVVEDLIHLLVVLISDRTSLVDADDDENGENSEKSALFSLRRDLIHVLCFRPLSYSDICNKLPDRFQDQEPFQRVLEEMTTFKAPDGNADVGTFELKPGFIEEVDPYIAHYNKNQREESEAAYRAWMAKKTGQPEEAIVYEPRLRPIPSGVFVGLGAFLSTGVFAQLVYYSVLYPLTAPRLTPKVASSRVETFLQIVLHLVLIAVAEDAAEDTEGPSFVHLALNRVARSNFMPEAPAAKTIVALLDLLSARSEFKACHAKIALILKRMRQKRPRDFEAAYARLGIPVDRISTASPAASSSAAEEERERKKRAALDRQARVMAQFQEQQKSFLAQQGEIDWGTVDEEEEDEEEVAAAGPAETTFWKYPGGTCILCQEETDERRLYGTFAFFTESLILRQTDLQDPDFVREAAATPKNLDRSAESIRPFGVAHENRQTLTKVSASGERFEDERQAIGRGFPSRHCDPGPLSVGCGHIMHYHCFEAYYDATLRRHHQQIARHHPEDTERLEFVCPLCKALGNAFLPIIWKGKDESYPGVLQPAQPFAAFLDDHLARTAVYAMGGPSGDDDVQSRFRQYIKTATVGTIQEKAAGLVAEAWEPSSRLPGSAPVNLWPAIPMAVPGGGATTAAAGATGILPRPPGGILRELVAVYRRLCKTLRTNELVAAPEAVDMAGPPELDGGDQLYGSSTLARAVGYSVSAVEIQQRGTDAEYGMTLLSKIPEQQLTHLRILCETVTSYLAVGGHRYAGHNQIEAEHRQASERQHCQLFMAQYVGRETEHTRQPVEHYPPLLQADPFVFLCECLFGLQPAQHLDVAHVLRLCYLAELVKVVYHVGRNVPVSAWIRMLMHPDTDDPSLTTFAAFCLAVVQLDVDACTQTSAVVVDASVVAADAPGEQQNRGFDQPAFATLAGYYALVQRYALVFLRKAVVLLYAHAGVDFNSHVAPAPELDELDRLTHVLRLPSFDDMCGSLVPREVGGWPATATMLRLVGGWIRHNFEHVHRQKAAAVTGDLSQPLSLSAPLSHPGIYELVGLPLHFDQLLDECTRCRCPTTGKDVSDPMLCLMCGTVFCGQAICCLKEEPGPRRQPRRRIGGAQQHMRKCQRNIGLFLSIRKCCIFYLHRGSGSYGYAPYIDKYGEVDLGFRHGRPLLLNQRRYDAMLRAVWLGHGIPSFISRKLEMDINNGGWETI